MFDKDKCLYHFVPHTRVIHTHSLWCARMMTESDQIRSDQTEHRRYANELIFCQDVAMHKIDGVFRDANDILARVAGAGVDLEDLLEGGSVLLAVLE